MKIVSFLPSATEMLFALGLGDQLAAVTFECDYPSAALAKPKVVHSHLPPGLSPAEIDGLVSAEGAVGRSLYFADWELLEALEPDLILLQDLCHVCAIDSPTLARDLSRLRSRPEVLSLSAQSLTGVFADIARVAEAAGCSRTAEALIETLHERVNRVRQLAPVLPAPRVLALEWLDPLFQGGHWIPEMIALAGGTPVAAEPGEKSVRLTWNEVATAAPELILAMPCGYDLSGTIEQYNGVVFPQGWDELPAVQKGQVYAVDGSAYFSRPGPRLVNGLEILGRIFREEPGEYVRLREAGVKRSG